MREYEGESESVCVSVCVSRPVHSMISVYFFLSCHHGAHSKCINCVPLEPWDKAVQEGRDPPIKHLSFHCYIRKLTSGVDKSVLPCSMLSQSFVHLASSSFSRGKFINLEDLSCKVKPGCVDHPPWPDGICTKCQPSAVYLARQVEFIISFMYCWL